jgi:hypothetical protein
VILKRAGHLIAYRGQTIVFITQISHGGKGTSVGKRRIKRWIPGPVSYRPDYKPNTWFSFGKTFSHIYRWPKLGRFGYVYPGHGVFRAHRVNRDFAQVRYRGWWYDIWKDSNPFGPMMADLTPGKIDLHGTMKDEFGNDVLPTTLFGEYTHGCIRVSNKSIQKIMNFAPPGTTVSIKN